jgi:hypothetical protein
MTAAYVYDVLRTLFGRYGGALARSRRFPRRRGRARLDHARLAPGQPRDA